MNSIHTQTDAQWSPALMIVGMVLMAAGCAPLDLREKVFGKVEPAPVIPSRIVAMWTDTVMYQAAKPGVRGFGARIYFYGPDDEEKPIEVDGSLTVYAFDAEKHSRGMPSPEKKYVFTAEQFKTHHSQTKIGHSYSVWLPWDELGGPTRQISLITRFEHRLGGVVVSDPSKSVLPGLSPEVGDGEVLIGQESTTEESVKQASHDADAQESVTIQIPPSFANKFRSAQRPSAIKPQQLERESDSTDVNQAAMNTEATSVRPDSAAAEALQELVGEAGELPYRQRLSDHFQQRRFPAGSSPLLSPAARQPRKQPYRAKWLSGLPPTPRSTVISNSDAP